MYSLFFNQFFAVSDAESSASSALALKSYGAMLEGNFVCLPPVFPVSRQYFMDNSQFRPLKNDKGQAPQHPPFSYFLRILPL